MTMRAARRRVLLLTTAMLVLGATLAPAPSGGGALAAEKATVLYRGDAARTGLGSGPDVSWVRGVAWSKRFEGPVRSSPLVVGDTVFAGLHEGALVALDVRDGAERWRYKAGAPVNAAPAVEGDRVYLTAMDNSIHAVDRRSGKRVWRVETGPDLPRFGGWDYIGPSPLLVDGVLYVGSGDGHLYALDARRGRELWKFRTGDRVRAPASFVDGTVLVAGFDGSLYRLDARTGAQVWRFDTDGRAHDSAAAGYDRNAIVGAPAVAGDVVVIGSRDGVLYGVNLADGTERWRIANPPPWYVSSPAVKDGIAVTGSSDGRFVLAVEAATGKEVWRSRVPSQIMSSATIIGDVSVIGCNCGHLFAHDLKTGQERWRLRLADGYVISTPEVAGGRIFVGTDDGDLIALEGRPAGGTERAIYWDEGGGFRYPTADVAKAKELFGAAGYRLLGRAELAGFLAERGATDRPGVLVLLSDRMDQALLTGGAQAPLRRFLQAGGKVVNIGMPPNMIQYDLEQGQGVGYDAKGADGLLDIRMQPTVGELHAAPTEEGRRWGLDGWTVAGAPAQPDSVTTVLARNDLGLAAAWVKSYGGPEGTGFVQLWHRFGWAADPATLLRIAEYGID